VNTTLPLWMYVATSVCPSDVTTSRRSAMVTRLRPPTLMPRRRATWVGTAPDTAAPPALPHPPLVKLSGGFASGPDFALVVRNAGRCDRPAGVATAAGIASGLLVHVGIVAAGRGAVIAASAVAFTVVKIAGAAYLVVVGLVPLIGALGRGPGPGLAAGGEPGAPVDNSGTSLPLGRAYRQGLLCNVLNPKAVLTYLALMPQFLPAIPSSASTVLLSAITVLAASGWFGLVALAVAAVRRGVAATSGTAGIDAATGSVLITFGVQVAIQPAR